MDQENQKPTYYKSRKWYMWKSLLSDRTCDLCRQRHGKVLPAMSRKKSDRQPTQTASAAW